MAELQGAGRRRWARTIKAYATTATRPPTLRQAIRAGGHIVVTNPDMLHTGILPHHTKWVKLFENLRYVVIDELHQYRGVFGSPRGQRDAPAAPHLRISTAPARLPLLLRHHRQPAASWPSG